jgi:predicted lysophospholipase L1 biosynthesis ABC-type transport system permease subunit
VVEVLMRTQSEAATKQARHFLGADRILRLNPTVPTGALSLDKVDAEALIGRASHESRIAAPAFTDCFADHLAPAYVPYYPTRKA